MASCDSFNRSVNNPTADRDDLTVRFTTALNRYACALSQSESNLGLDVEKTSTLVRIHTSYYGAWNEAPDEVLSKGLSFLDDGLQRLSRTLVESIFIASFARTRS